MTLSDETLTDAEEFICQLYSGYETDTKISDVRFKLFNKNSKDFEKLPPTQSSLQQHIKRAHHQCVVWQSSVVTQPNIPSPVGNGWYNDLFTGQTLPHLMTEEPITGEYLQLTQCQCKNCAYARCRCGVKKLQCTAGCGCSDGTCRNPFNNSDSDNSD